MWVKITPETGNEEANVIYSYAKGHAPTYRICHSSSLTLARDCARLGQDGDIFHSVHTDLMMQQLQYSRGKYARFRVSKIRITLLHSFSLQIHNFMLD